MASDMPVRELVASAEAIDPGDCVKTRRFIRRAERGSYGFTQTKVLAAAKRELKPKAIDWTAILEFIQKLLPIILPFIVKGRK